MPMYQAPQRKQQDITHNVTSSGKNSSPAAGNDSMHLQRALGNHAVGALLGMQANAGPGVAGFSSLAVQAKMTVRPAGDMFEQEADQMAKMVVDKISAPAPAAGEPSVQRMEGTEAEEEELQMKSASEGIQRMEGMESEEEELQMKPVSEGIQRMEGMEAEEEELQMKPASEGIQRMEGMEAEEEELQMKSSGDGFDAAPSIEQDIQAKKGGGGRLDADIQAKMESAFQTDLSSVNIHTDGQSDQLNQSIGARAFTTGNDIFFRQGEYNPSSRDGQELLGHELTHVIQQRNGRV